ncbi:MAG: magnesium transporter, partial [Colwellia sp.]
MPEIIEQENIHQKLHQVKEALDSGMFVYVRKLFQELSAYDLALILESSTAKSRPVLWQLIDAEYHGEVLEELNEEVRKGILQSMRPEKLAAVAE